MNVQRIATALGATPPVTAAELMAWARVTDPQEQSTFDRLIAVACQEVERFTGYVTLAGTFVVTTPWTTSDVQIPLTPVSAVHAVRAIDPYGASVVEGYYALISVAPAIVRVGAYSLYPSGTALEVELDAGYDAVTDVPEDVRQTVFDVALLHYTHRDDPELLSRIHAYLGTVSTTLGIVQV